MTGRERVLAALSGGTPDANLLAMTRYAQSH
jgi:hypothetical protein